MFRITVMVLAGTVVAYAQPANKSESERLNAWVQSVLDGRADKSWRADVYVSADLERCGVRTAKVDKALPRGTIEIRTLDQIKRTLDGRESVAHPVGGVTASTSGVRC